MTNVKNVLPQGDPRHGTETGYRKCACADCAIAHALRNRAQRTVKKFGWDYKVAHSAHLYLYLGSLVEERCWTLIEDDAWKNYFLRIMWSIKNRKHMPADKVLKTTCGNKCMNMNHVELAEFEFQAERKEAPRVLRSGDKCPSSFKVVFVTRNEAWSVIKSSAPTARKYKYGDVYECGTHFHITTRTGDRYREERRRSRRRTRERE